MEPDERGGALLARPEELTDVSHDLRDTERRWWRDPLPTFALATAGAAGLGAGPLHGPLGGVPALAAAGAALAGAVTAQEPTTACSYVFDARRELGSRTA